MHLRHGLAHTNSLCGWYIVAVYLLEGNFLVLFIFMGGCEVQVSAYLGAFGWL